MQRFLRIFHAAALVAAMLCAPAAAEAQIIGGVPAAVITAPPEIYPGARVALDFAGVNCPAGQAQCYRALGVQTTTFRAIPNLTLTRASVGYAETRGGQLVLFGPNEPRVTDKGLLVEEARTNLYNTSTPGASGWAYLGGASAVLNDAVAPDGTQTASRLVEGTIAAAQDARTPVVSTTATTTYSVSGYMKAGTRTYGHFGISGAFNGNFAPIHVDLLTATIINAPTGYLGYGARMLANGWVYVWAVGTASVTATGSNYCGLNQTGTTANYAGDGASYIYAWGFQMEVGAFPTTLIPANGAAATRPADLVSIGGLNLRSGYTFVAAAEYLAFDTTTATRVAQLDGGNNNDLVSFIHSNNTGQNSLDVSVGGVFQGSVGSGVANTGAQVLAGRVQDANLAISRNGGAAAMTSAIAAMPTVSVLRIGQGAGNAQLNGYLRRVAIYPRAFSDPELQAASMGPLSYANDNIPAGVASPWSLAA